MRAFLAAALIALLPSSLWAATISYEHPFSLATHDVFPGNPYPEELRMDHYFSSLRTEWDVPAFDPELGIPIVLFLELFATPSLAITVDPPDTNVSAYLFLINPISGLRDSADGYSGHIFPVEIQPFHWVIETHADSHAFYDIRASATFDILIEGVARATYVYEPAATAVPEAPTMFLLGSGLAVSRARWRRQRDNSSRLRR